MTVAFKNIFHLKLDQNNIFFILKNSYLKLTHQNYLKFYIYIK